MKFKKGEIIQDQHGNKYVYARGIASTCWVIYCPDSMLISGISLQEDGMYHWNNPNTDWAIGPLTFTSTNESLL